MTNGNSRNRQMSVAEHLVLGQRLAQLRHDLTGASLALQRHGVGVTSAHQKRLQRAEDAVDEIRSDMDARACREHPHEFDTHWYYPGQPSRSPATTGDAL